MNIGKDAFNMVNFLKKIIYNDMIKMVSSIRNNISDKKLFICLDIESSEQNPDSIREIGWCVFSMNELITKNKHFIVKESTMMNENSSSEENKFHYGETKILELKEISEEFKKDLKDIHYILSQRVEEDIRHLKQMAVDVTKFIRMKDLKITEYGIIDMNDIYSGVYHVNTMGLDECLKKNNLKHDNLKNAGNNANYLKQIFKKLIILEKPKKYDTYNELIKNIREEINDEKLFLCLDIEAFEFDQKILTEFGWCIFRKDGTIDKKIHAIVKENIKYRNKKHVPDNREYYLFGESVTQNLSDIEKELKEDIEKVNYLVGQGIESDIRYLNSIKIHTSKFEKMKSSKVPEYGIIDTMDIYSGFYHSKGVGLEKSLIKLQLPYGRLHNAGKYFKIEKKKKKKNIEFNLFTIVCNKLSP